MGIKQTEKLTKIKNLFESHNMKATFRYGVIFNIF